MTKTFLKVLYYFDDSYTFDLSQTLVYVKQARKTFLKLALVPSSSKVWKYEAYLCGSLENIPKLCVFLKKIYDFGKAQIQFK